MMMLENLLAGKILFCFLKLVLAFTTVICMYACKGLEKEASERHEERKAQKKTLKPKGLGSFYFLFRDHSSECLIAFRAFVVPNGKL